MRVIRISPATDSALWITTAGLEPRARGLLAIPAAGREVRLRVLAVVSQRMHHASLRVRICVLSRRLLQHLCEVSVCLVEVVQADVDHPTVVERAQTVLRVVAPHGSERRCEIKHRFRILQTQTTDADVDRLAEESR